MFEKFWEILKEKDSLLDQSRKQSLSMLGTCREMLESAMQGIKAEASEDVRESIRKTDRIINKQEREVRKMVFEHLSLSSNSDLLLGLQILNIVIDIERIGDNIKNIADISTMLPGKFSFGEDRPTFDELEKRTLEIFDLTVRGLETNDPKKGEKVTVLYQGVSSLCDQQLERLLTSGTSSDMVEKKYVAMALLFRYLKRVNAHLKNVSTTLVNPFHRIGYRPH